MVDLAVNGSLMRGFDLNRNLIDARAKFVREDRTKPVYRMWSINDAYPAMLRDVEAGGQIELEIWSMSAQGLVQVLEKEPLGLTIGKIELADGGEVLGVLGEPYICQNRKEITEFGGWRQYFQIDK